jgi:hypothetical protein
MPTDPVACHHASTQWGTETRLLGNVGAGDAREPRCVKEIVAFFFSMTQLSALYPDRQQAKRTRRSCYSARVARRTGKGGRAILSYLTALSCPGDEGQSLVDV